MRLVMEGKADLGYRNPARFCRPALTPWQDGPKEFALPRTFRSGIEHHVCGVKASSPC